MLDALAPIAAAARLHVPPEHRRPIGVIGAGAIVNLAHLPAYRAGGLDVRGIFDLDQDRGADVAARHHIGRVYESLEALLADDDIAVVDIAVNPSAQPDIAHRALDAGKHLLCQKPLAPDWETASAIADAGRAAHRHVAVNQQLRFSEAIAAAKAMIDRGWIGEPLAIRFDVDIATDWTQWPWLAQSDRLEVQYHSIHYLDAVRHLLGDPDAVLGRGTRKPGAATVGETRTTSVLLYPGDRQATVMVNHDNTTGDAWATFRIDGTDGVITGTLGLLYDYPDGRPDTLDVRSQALPTDGWLHYPITTRWLPDAFLGPMGSLLAAIHDGSEPLTNAADNVRTVALVDSLYTSMASGQVETVPDPTRVDTTPGAVGHG